MKTFFIKLHRILGSILSLVFLVWFLSGFVMIYSGFPRADRKEAFEQSEPLNDYKNQILFPTDTTHKPQEVTLEIVNRIPVYTFAGNTLNAQTLLPIKCFAESVLDSLVQARYQSAIARKEILENFDAWIPWSRFAAYFPIHKYYLADDAKTQVYIASTTGKVVQESTSKKRWLARFGAIPHWFYFKSLRLHADLWSELIIWVSGIGAIMCLSGLVVGIFRSRKLRKLKKKGLLGFSPYKEKWYRWHHVFGMTFGVFAFTFVFSGMLSLMSIPQWLLPIDKTKNYKEIWNEAPPCFSDFQLSLPRVLEDERFSGTKQVQFKQLDGIPYYVLYKEYRKPLFVVANEKDTIAMKVFSYTDIVQIVARKFKGVPYKVEQLTASDNYYKLKGEVGAKVSFDDPNRTWGYIDASNPTTLRSVNKSNRASRWLYKGLHTFKFPKLSKVPWLRKTLLIIVSIFGTIISLSGVVLSYRYFKKKVRKLKK